MASGTQKNESAGNIVLFEDRPDDATPIASCIATVDDDGLPDINFTQLDKPAALASIEIAYQPIWDLRHKVIANYFATAGAKTSYGQQLWDDELRREYAEVLSPAEFDTFVARRVLRDIEKYMAKGPRSLIGWPVHFETIAARASRHPYIELCRAIPEAIRKLLVLELDGLPDGAPTSRLVDIFGALRPFCRYLIVRVSPEFRRFNIFQGMPVGGVGFSMSGLEAGDRRCIATMNDFVAAAANAGLRAYVHGLSNRAQVLAAVAAGFEWINGTAVDRPVDLPGRMMRFDLRDLYRSLA